MYKKLSRAISLIVTLGVIVQGWFWITPTFAQDTETGLIGSIVYTRRDSSGTVEHVRRSAQRETRIVVDAQQCSSVSPDGNFVAIASESSDILTIYNLVDDTMQFEVAWSDMWQPCLFGWDDSGQLTLSTDSNILISIDPLTGESTSLESNDLVITPPAVLPNQLPSQPVLISPNGRTALYSQCYDTTTQEFCSGDKEMVIYDLVTQQVIVPLLDTTDAILRQTEFPPSSIAAFWSPSGRYLTYFTTGSDARVPFQIYDIEVRQFINSEVTDTVVVDPILSGFRWSLNEDLLGFWRRTGIELPNQETQFTSLNPSNGQIFTSELSYLLKGANNWRWSPDNQSIAFVTSAGTLTQYSIGSGETVILDQGVDLIYSWTD